MKKITCALLFGLSLCASCAFAFPKEPEGYKGFRWGTEWHRVSRHFVESRAPRNGYFYYNYTGSKYNYWENFLRVNDISYVFSPDGFFTGMIFSVDDNSSYFNNAYNYAVEEWGHPEDMYNEGRYKVARWVGSEVEIILTETLRGWELEYIWLGENGSRRNYAPPRGHDRGVRPTPPPARKPEPRPRHRRP